ncbi:MAG: alpha/beta hydrolase, partial [Saprospiraceae bacterium]
DPMLSKAGVRSGKKMCAENDNLKDERISPIYGRFDGFPKTLLFLGESDITYPDQKIVVEKMRKANVDLVLEVGENMIHIWPFLPVMKEAEISLKKIISLLNN